MKICVIVSALTFAIPVFVNDALAQSSIVRRGAGLIFGGIVGGAAQGFGEELGKGGYNSLNRTPESVPPADIPAINVPSASVCFVPSFQAACSLPPMSVYVGVARGIYCSCVDGLGNQYFGLTR